MSYAEYSTCLSLGSSRMCYEYYAPICQFIFSISESNHFKVNFLLNETTGSSYCNVKTTGSRELFILTHQINLWVYSIPRKTKFKCFCENGMWTKDIKGEGTIYIPPGCHIRINSILINGHREFKMDLNLNQLSNYQTSILVHYLLKLE